MKKILFAISAVALLFATSCKKESVNPAIDVPEGSFLATIDNGANPQNAPRINDGMGTMTVIDTNRYVLWESGDEISINGSIYTTDASGSSVIFSGGKASGSKYHAFYPASIAGEGAAGILPDTQTYVSGKVSNLPMYANSESNQLTFYNICAALKITIPSFLNGATRIEVSCSDKAMNGAFSVNANNTAVMSNETPSDAEKKITAQKSTGTFATNEVVYIAVPANTYGNFKVEFFNGTTSMWDKTLATCTLDVNKVYNINVTPKPVDLGLSVKWAPFNVGANSPEEYGDYFAWGETEPYYSSLSPLTWKAGKSAGYDLASYPYLYEAEDDWGWPVIAERGTQPYNATSQTLMAEYDAANVNWGGNWRMPTKAELEELTNTVNCTLTWTTDYNNTGIAGLVITSKKEGYTGNSIFLPAAGTFSGTSYQFTSSYSNYWSATHDNLNIYNAYFMRSRLNNTYVTLTLSTATRYAGYPVRPVYDPN